MFAVIPNIKMIALALVMTILSGYWLSHSGKPFNTFIFTLHKLVAVGTIIYIGVNLYRLYQAQELAAFVELSVIVITALLFLALVVSGGILSVGEAIGKAMPGVVLMVHQVAPLLAAAAVTLAVYLLAYARS